LIAAYEAVVQQKGPPVPTKLLLGSGDNGPHRARRRSAWSWLLAIVLIGALLFLALRFVSHVPPPAATVGGLSETLSSTESSPASSAAAPETSSSNAAALPSVSMSENSSAGSTSPASPAIASPAPAPSAKPVASAASTTANPAADTPAGNNEVAAGTGLSLTFKATSWVRIEDTYGKVLLSGVMQAGTHQSIDGRRPLSVFLGNAPGVSATDAGKPINIAPYVKDNATARFTVP
jgi:cytoskeleton protein RodZ